MERSALAKILADIPGIDGKKDAYQASNELRLDVHVGEGGRPVSFEDIVKIELHDAFVLLISRETEARHYFEYDSVVGLSAKPVARAGRRPGFS